MREPVLETSQDAAMRWLIDRQLVSASDLVCKDVRIEAHSSRHRCYSVHVGTDAGVFLKLARERAAGRELEREASMYARLSVDPLIRAYLPALLSAEQSTGALVIALVPYGRTLRTSFAQRGVLSLKLAAAIGHAVGVLHSSPALQSADADWRRDTPWIFRIFRPSMALYLASSAANHRLLEAIQSEADFEQLLGQVAAGWSPTAHIHGDLRWDNVIVGHGGASRNRKPALVDWELADWGDPCWDVGCFLAEFLSAWVLSMPFVDGMSVGQSAALARLKLDGMQPAMRAFWSAYVARTSAGPGEARNQKVHVAQMAGARLLQTAYERSADAGEFSRAAAMHLQLALNLLRHPADAVTSLFGLLDA
jgi:hypothetical protein